jgi:hypothetical protein
MEINWEVVVKDINDINNLIQDLSTKLGSLTEFLNMVMVVGQTSLDDFPSESDENE